MYFVLPKTLVAYPREHAVVLLSEVICHSLFISPKCNCCLSFIACHNLPSTAPYHKVVHYHLSPSRLPSLVMIYHQLSVTYHEVIPCGDLQSIIRLHPLRAKMLFVVGVHRACQRRRRKEGNLDQKK